MYVSVSSPDGPRCGQFDFAEGTIIEPIAPGITSSLIRFSVSRTNQHRCVGIKGFYPASDTYFTYCHQTAESIAGALAQLDRYVKEEGPFDGAIGFSQGASIIASYLLQQSKEHPTEPLPFQCAIFFSSARPFDTSSLTDGPVRWAEPEADRPLLRLPTAHLWGSEDSEYREGCQLLCAMCEDSQREVYIHGLGHEIPGPRAKEEVQGCVRAIRRTIEKASVDR